MAIHVHDIKEWRILLIQSRDELARIFGSRGKKHNLLWTKLDNAIKKSEEIE